MSATISTTAFPDSKKHYEILDALRGVAAIMVVIFHVFETHNTSRFDQIMNHGYLAVDFFFLLSGFVIGYAYDDRWDKMSLKQFFTRRLIRLHPMIIMGMIVGAVLYYFQVSDLWPIIGQTPVWKMLLVMLFGFTLLPLTPSMEIRGWTEMHPLDGPAWSLFYEYIGNILYAVFVRKFSNVALSILVFGTGVALIHFLVTGPNGDVIGGWSLTPTQVHIGFLRLLFPFFGGLLLSRITKPTQINQAFLWCSLLVILSLSIPRIGDATTVWMNGIYESIVIIVVFPLIVYMGASGTLQGKTAKGLGKFLGDISYPIYITHYPIIYTYTAWVKDNKVSLSEAWPYGLLVIISSISLAYICLKFYDIPVRKWLTDRYIYAKK
ncbi:MAG: acyltransferase [Saprospiraceae bacterium]|nr:acyltransferase [Saprospiraceae bacterium]